MKAISCNPYASFVSAVSDSTRLLVGQLSLPLIFAMALATGATLASLGIAINTGWQSGGLLIERIIRIVLIVVAVLFVHWLPMVWSAFRGFARFAAFALWSVALSIVLYGQVAFFMLSQQHAGDLRAAAVSAPPGPTSSSRPVERSRTEIAKEAAKVSTTLARAQAARCVGDCPNFNLRRARLAAELTALEVEAGEAKRREASEDRRLAQADRLEELRATLRVDPVAFAVASWLGATTHFLELIIGLAHAVVLEGAAVVGWLLVSVAPGRAVVVSDWGAVRSDPAGSRETVVSGREATVPERDAVAPGRAVAAGENAGSLVTSEDDLLLQKIHEAVVAGELKPTQESIRKFLRCGQPKAGSLNRQYLAHFGSMCSQGGDVRAPDVATPAVADG